LSGLLAEFRESLARSLDHERRCAARLTDDKAEVAESSRARGKVDGCGTARGREEGGLCVCGGGGGREGGWGGGGLT
jgi:hypothetical protein